MKKIYTHTQYNKTHEVTEQEKIFVTNRDMGTSHIVDLEKRTYEVDALEAFFLLQENGDFLLLEDGGRIIDYYG
jgi:hypothetical protein